MASTIVLDDKSEVLPAISDNSIAQGFSRPQDEERAIITIETSPERVVTSTNSPNNSLAIFDGPDDPMNPLNWPAHRKWAVTILTSLTGLVTLMSSSMIAPALPNIGHDLRISDAETNIVLSIFILCLNLGRLVMAPLSEVYGRRPIWLCGSIIFFIWNGVCGFARNKALMITSRLLSGLGASGDYAIGNPVLSDMWKPEERGKSLAIATFLPLLGPALGPMIGGIVTEQCSWSWLFWIVSIFDLALIFVGLIVFPETHAPSILSHKAAHLQSLVGTVHDSTSDDQTYPKLIKNLSVALGRPIRLLFTEPIIQLMSLFLAYNFGVLYIMLSTFAALWTTRYHQSVSISGIHYFAMAIGYTIASQVGGPLTDRIWAHLKSRSPSGTTAPEFRVPLMIPGAILIPLGLFWYGWSAESKVYWLVTDIGAGVFGCGIILGTQAMQAYVMDAYPEFTASASAASQLLRGFAASGFPAFAPAMYTKLGYGWGSSLLAFVFIALGVPEPLILWKFGARLRAKGKSAV